MQVHYRNQCDFRTEDAERDLSARMIDMDEHYFTPTMAKHSQAEDVFSTRTRSYMNEGPHERPEVV